MTIRPSIILVNPQIGENIGAIARIMKNFSLTDLRLVNPRDGWPNRKAEVLAVGGIDIIKDARVYENLEDALGDIEAVYACSARLRKLNKECYNLKEHIVEIRSLYSQDSNIALMFGSERCGLLNEELKYATKIINISANQEYPILNLSHAVSIVIYEYFNLQSLSSHQIKYKAKSISVKELSFFLNDLQNKLSSTGFFDTEARQEKMFQAITNIFTRIPNLSSQELKTLIGAMKALYKFTE